MASLAVLADDLAGAFQLTRQALIRANDLVERIGDFSSEASLVACKADGKVAVAYGLKSPQKLAQVEGGYLGIFFAIRLGFANRLGTATRAYLRFHQQTPGNTISK
jgi:hypothetical protein